MVIHDAGWVAQTMAQAKEILAAWDPAAIPAPAAPTNAAEVAAAIDHTQLKAEATPAMVAALCQEAVQYHFASVCVNSSHVALCAERVKGTSVSVCSVVGFPLGAAMTEAKVHEAELAIAAGATEIDMVIAVGLLKAGMLKDVFDDIAAVVKACQARGAISKVIIETALLTDEEKVTACLLIKEAGADFCKTSTGFSTGGATLHDVALMRRTIGPEMGIKAAGGVRTYADAVAMIAAGATRLGASASVQIVGGAPPAPPTATTPAG